MKKILLFLVLATFMISCEKESSNPVKTDDNPYLNGNDKPENSYWPSSKGSWWKYEGAIAGQDMGSTITCIDEQKIDDVYYASMRSIMKNQNDEYFIRVQNNQYFVIGFGTDYGVSKEYELCFLKPDEPIGTEWISSELYLNNTRNRYIFEVLDKLDTYVVRGKTYTDIIFMGVETQSFHPYLNEWSRTSKYGMYFSKSVGWIKLDFGYSGKVELVDYSIK
jgi:hypothetical protein